MVVVVVIVVVVAIFIETVLIKNTLSRRHHTALLKHSQSDERVIGVADGVETRSVHTMLLALDR